MLQKAHAITNIAVPKNKKEVLRFIVLINYYRDLWDKRSKLITPLTMLTSKDVKWEWNDIHQNAFNKIKQIVARETLLAYPDFSKPFVAIPKKNQPIAFYSRK